MHWFLEQIKEYYPQEIEKVKPLYHPNEVIRVSENFKFEHLYLLLSVIEHGGVFFFGRQYDYPEKVQIPSGFILSTSGTTGQAKLVLYSFEKFLEKYRNVKKNPIKTLMIMGIDHIGGMDTFFSVVSRGGELIFPKEITPKCIAENIEKHQIEFLSLSPSFLNLMLMTNVKDFYDLSSLKKINFGAEVMPVGLLARLKETFPGVEFCQTFGTTETGTVYVKKHPDNPLLIKIPNSKIIDSKLYIQSSYGMIEYLGMENPIDSDGYFFTGDLVEEYEDGYLRILGREKDSVNIGGEKIFYQDVENLLFQLKDVKDAKVYSQENAILGKILVADVVWDSDQNIKKKLKEITDNKYLVPSKINLVERIEFSHRFKKVR